MIAGIFHSGSGLGNQLHRYIATRVFALDREFDFTMVAPENFKGSSFMNLDMGKDLNIPYHTELPAGKVVPDIDWKTYQEDPFHPKYLPIIDDNTVIDGEFQGEQYFNHRRKEINEWLKVEPMALPDDLCVIGFRGGEYRFIDWFLPQSYWDEAIENMRERGINQFKVVTDDPETAQTFFPDFEVTHEIGSDWRHIRYAKNLILANSSFFILPAWLNETAYILAPLYWAGFNRREWLLPQNQYKSFHYLK